MEEENKRRMVLIFAILTLIFSATSLITPWWKIGTTFEYEAMNESTPVEATYSLFQQITANSGNISITVPFTNVTTKSNSQPLSNLFHVTLILTSVGIAFSGLTAILIYTAFAKNEVLLKFAKFTSVIAAITLFMATVYFQSEFAASISKFDSVVPTVLVNNPIKGSSIGGFWGGIEMSSGLFAWIWTAGSGWYLAFTAFLLNIITYSLIARMFKKK